MLFADSDFFQPPQRPQPHIEDRFGLNVGQFPLFDHDRLGLVLLADDTDHLVKIEIGDQVTFENFEPVFDFGETVFRPAHQNVFAVLQEGPQDVAQVHHPRHHVGAQHVHVQPDPRFKIGRPEQLFHQDLGLDGPVARLQYQPDVFCAFVPQVAEQRQFLQVQQIRDFFDQAALLNLVGNFGHHDLVLPVAELFNLPARAQPEGSASGRIGLGNRIRAFDQNAAGRKVRSRHHLDQFRDRRIRELQQVQQRRTYFIEIMRRNIGGHADRDAGGAVAKQIRHAGGQQDGFFLGAVIVFAEIDRVFVDPFEHGDRIVGQPGFGVPHRGGVIAVDIAEIALPFDQRIADGKILGKPDHRIVDRNVTMGMILADHVADDTCAFLETRLRFQPQLAHREKQPAVNRFQPVAHIGQRTGRDRRQGVGQIAFAQSIGKIHLLHAGGDDLVSHGYSTLRLGFTRYSSATPQPVNKLRARGR